MMIGGTDIAKSGSHHLSREIELSHAGVTGEVPRGSGVRNLVEESWNRSLRRRLDPDQPPTGLEFDHDELLDYRDAHPLARALPTIQRLLTRHTIDASLIVAIGDQDGRLLWIDGDRVMRRKAEEMLFVEGANWSEPAMGTNAPGTALELDRPIQIRRAEHFNRIVHPWSCTAVPVHDPISRALLGVIDITGGDAAADPATLPLVEATVAAVEAELHVRRLGERHVAPSPSSSRTVRQPAGNTRLSVLGTDVGYLDVASRRVDVSMRHAEILTILAWHPDGLSAEKLATLVYGPHGRPATLRAEMVRLRKALERVSPRLLAASRPYRLDGVLDLDARKVLDFLERGAHRVALSAYSGTLLPSSVAPGVVRIRDEVQQRLRDALLTGASADTLLEYARRDEATYDLEVWRACLTLMPVKSPKRGAIVAHIERVESELGVQRG